MGILNDAGADEDRRGLDDKHGWEETDYFSGESIHYLYEQPIIFSSSTDTSQPCVTVLLL